MNEIWQKVTEIGIGAKDSTIDISNEIWQRAVDAGPVLQTAILKAYNITTSSETKEILNECQEIAVIVTRISTIVLSVNALETIKKRTCQGTELGSSIIPGYGTIIGATLGAAFGLCEVAYNLLNDPSLKKEVNSLYQHCETLVFLIKKNYNVDMSPLAAGTKQLSPIPSSVSAHPFVKNPRPITFGPRYGY